MPDIRIIEVGPRDGLQNEKTPISTETKLEFINQLVGSGLKEIEVTSFVSPKWVPQLADSAEIFVSAKAIPGIIPSALVPNAKGLEKALSVGAERIALFTAASDAFTQKNINMTVEESLTVFAEVAQVFKSNCPNGWIRGYVSTIVQDPFAGKVEPAKVASVVARLLETGVDEISLGETVGVAIPQDIIKVAEAVEDVCPKARVSWHFHDTRGTAVSCVSAMLDRGYRSFDSSAAGLGGCPYAPGAGGNLATEDLVYFCERSGLSTGVDLDHLSRASLNILDFLKRSPTAKAQLAQLAVCKS